MTHPAPSGAVLIGSRSMTCTETFQAHDATTGAALPGSFSIAGEAEIDMACRLADTAFDSFRALPPARRAAFLDAIAAELEADTDAIVARAMAETALPDARLRGECARTTGQLRLFGTLLREGQVFDTRIVIADPARKPAPRPAQQMVRIGIGPVAVFGASNFPLAFSVAGGDTASALAAGCPVVARAHPAHPGTSALVGASIIRAAHATDMPDGVFSLIGGPDHAIGAALVRHPAIAAIGFTGSRSGGTALAAIAAQRPVPIPVFAEMSSINPVLLLPGALAERTEALAQGFAGSLALGAGQFCTNPGLILAIKGPDLESFIQATRAVLPNIPGQTMLTPGIRAACAAGIATLARQNGVTHLAGDLAQGGTASPVLFAASSQDFRSNPILGHEIFGPVALIVTCTDETDLTETLRGLEGQLTITLQTAQSDLPAARALLPLLERKAGRILANGWPTGVDVGPAMVHGGPYPATTDVRTTSVGTAAIERFLRPVCYQDLPAELLPGA